MSFSLNKIQYGENCYYACTYLSRGNTALKRYGNTQQTKHTRGPFPESIFSLSGSQSGS